MKPDNWQNPHKVYSGTRFDVYTADLAVRDGSLKSREVVVPPDAVVILPMLDLQRVVMIRNDRFAAGRTLWELPAGTIEPGEDPAACAARELAEETGYEARRMVRILEFFPTPGFCTEYHTIYLAQDLEYVGQNLDETESIVPETLLLYDAIQMIQAGEILDAKTIATLLYYHTFLIGD